RVAHLQDRHVFLWLELPVPQNQLSNDIRNRAETADSEPLAFEIFRLANLFTRHNCAVKAVDRHADNLEIDAGQGRLDLRRQVRGCELNAAADNRLIHKRAAADIDALRAQTILFEGPVLFHHLQQIVGDPDAAIADLDRLQRLYLSSN